MVLDKLIIVSGLFVLLIILLKEDIDIIKVIWTDVNNQLFRLCTTSSILFWVVKKLVIVIFRLLFFNSLIWFLRRFINSLLSSGVFVAITRPILFGFMESNKLPFDTMATLLHRFYVWKNLLFLMNDLVLVLTWSFGDDWCYFFSRAFVSSFWSTSELSFYLLGTDKVALVVESFLAILERGLLMKTTSFMTLVGWAA